MPSRQAEATLKPTKASGGEEMNKILVATDGSESAAEAVQLGVSLAAQYDAELVFVHVVPAVDLVPATWFGVGGAFPHETAPEDRALLEDAAAVAEEQGVFSTTMLLIGNTVDEIVAYADSHDVDLIVVGSRGHGAIANTFLGSVSRGVLQESTRPVLVARGSTAHSPDVRRLAGIGLGF
jgi:nucleotide-binding universal stress UspA family protein